MKLLHAILLSLVALQSLAFADAIRQTKGGFYDAFRQLDVDLPTPNTYRTASGAPGSQYWQQRADYKIDVSLDESLQRITASETVNYTNNSPDSLRYIWLQLDQNRFAEGSAARVTEAASSKDQLSYSALARQQIYDERAHGHELTSVTDSKGKDLKYTIVDTMMRIDLPKALAPGDSHSFKIDWAFNIINNTRVGGRNGFEHFSESDTYIFFLAQWFPRLVAYTDYTGW
ncbi:MAG: aminopeptidase, partial [Verrucomicrobiia bacterium]